MVRKGQPGHPHTEEHKAHMREVMKGKNVGKVRSEETKQKIGQSQKGKVLSEETKRKMSEAQKGRTVSEETRQKLREANLGKKQSEEANQKRREAMQRIDTPEYRAKVSQGVRRAYENSEFRASHIEQITSPEVQEMARQARINRVYTPEQREVKRQQMIERWKNDNGAMLKQAREQVTLATRASQEVSVSSLEIQVKSLLDVFGIAYEQQKAIGIYTGDFFLPDYNLIIEVYGCYWHACPECGYSYPKKTGYDERRKNYIQACGYDVFILWEHDLDLTDALFKALLTQL